MIQGDIKVRNAQAKGFERFVKMIQSPSFFIVWLILMIASFFLIDKGIARFFQPHDIGLYTFSTGVTPFGYPNAYILLSLILAIIGYFYFKQTRLFSGSIFILVSLVSTALVQNILKVILGRARPAMLFENDQFGFYLFQTTNDFWGLPSGLITTMTAIFISLCFIFPKYWLGFVIAMVLLSVTRLFVTIHFLSDVMATLYIMSLVVILWAAICKKHSWLLWRKQASLGSV